MLEVHDVTVRFGGVVAVDHVSLSVADGSTLGLVGPNGSGKSTLLNALTGVVTATGRATLDGRQLPLGKPRRTRRAGLARTFQHPQNFEELSCIDNVLLADGDRRYTGLTGAWIARPAMWKSERTRWRRALEMLDLVGLGDAAEKPASLLSYGQQRMLELARSLVGDPQILLLDEPLDSLDLPNQASVARLVGQLCRDRGVAVVMVAHDVNPILPYLDQVTYLAPAGTATGTPAEVITTSTLSRLYGVPIEVLTTSDGRLVVVGQPDAPAHHVDRHEHGHP
jgi:zinc/manganese transport system ATP-binding protein